MEQKLKLQILISTRERRNLKELSSLRNKMRFGLERNNRNDK